MAPEYTPFSAVCKRTFTRSNGWPTTTAQTPPTPPAAKERMPDAKEDFVVSTTSDATCSFEGRSSLEGREGMMEFEEELEEGEDVGGVEGIVEDEGRKGNGRIVGSSDRQICIEHVG